MYQPWWGGSQLCICIIFRRLMTPCLCLKQARRLLEVERACIAGKQEQIELEASQNQAEVMDLALDLSRQRLAAVPYLKMAVEACLADLAMPGSCFDIQLAWEPADEVSAGLIFTQ